jgi:glutathione S-transferase
MPVSNNGARCRLIIYKKQIADVEIQAPSVLGGLKSTEYLQRNPQGKMPLLVSCPNEQEGGHLDLAESDTIARYLLSKYASLGPSFQPDNPRSNLMARIHDMYITTIQGALYKATPPFGSFGTRKTALVELQKQLLVLENLLVVDNNGLYLCGDDVSLADATIFPTLVFLAHMLPKFDILPALPTKLDQYYNEVASKDMDFAKVRKEIMDALQGWETNKRWDGILGAGWRDTAPSTLFDRIIAGQIPARIVTQPDDGVLAFQDINPVAPAHVLVIPKDRNGLTRLTNANAEHYEILGRLMVRISFLLCFSLVSSLLSLDLLSNVVVCPIFVKKMSRSRPQLLPRTSHLVLETGPALLLMTVPMVDKKWCICICTFWEDADSPGHRDSVVFSFALFPTKPNSLIYDTSCCFQNTNRAPPRQSLFWSIRSGIEQKENDWQHTALIVKVINP